MQLFFLLDVLHLQFASAEFPHALHAKSLRIVGLTSFGSFTMINQLREDDEMHLLVLLCSCECLACNLASEIRSCKSRSSLCC